VSRPPVITLAAFVVLLPAVLALPAHAADRTDDGALRVRARVQPETVLVGQKAEVMVDVMTNTWFAKAPRLPDDIPLERAVVIRPDVFGVNATERIGSETFAVQSRSYRIFPQAAGTLAIPPIPVTIPATGLGADTQPPVTLETPALELTVRPIPGAARGLPPVVSRRFQAEQTYDRTTDSLMVGDALVRRIELTADEVPALLLPALDFTAADGIAVYPEQPAGSEARNRGQLVGTRTLAVTYVFEQAGSFVLPEEELPWWDLSAGELRSVTLPALQLEVAPNPALTAEQLGGDPEEQAAPGTTRRQLPWQTWLAIAATVAAVVVGVKDRVRDLLASVASRWRLRRAESTRFAALRRAARAGDAAAAHTALQTWLDFVYAGQNVTPTSFAACSSDAQLATAVAELGRAAYGEPAASWNGDQLVGFVTRYRRPHDHCDDRPPTLTTLNPIGTESPRPC
jgi:hypothetical protein